MGRQPFSILFFLGDFLFFAGRVGYFNGFRVSGFQNYRHYEWSTLLDEDEV